jgi:hypothetical protein
VGVAVGGSGVDVAVGGTGVCVGVGVSVDVDVAVDPADDVALSVTSSRKKSVGTEPVPRPRNASSTVAPLCDVSDDVRSTVCCTQLGPAAELHTAGADAITDFAVVRISGVKES